MVRHYSAKPGSAAAGMASPAASTRSWGEPESPSVDRPEVGVSVEDPPATPSKSKLLAAGQLSPGGNPFMKAK